MIHSLLFKAFSSQSSYLRPALLDLGLGRGQPRILRFLSENGPSSQKEIAEKTGLDPASVSRMTDILQKNSFIEKRSDEDSRRSNKLSITKKGIEAVKIWNRETEKVERMMLKGFSENEIKELKELLSRITENMREGQDGRF